MKFKIGITLALISLITLVGFAVGCGQSAASKNDVGTSPIAAATPPAAANASDDVFNGEKIVKTEDEWRKQLMKEQFYVLREEGTEHPFTGEYDKHKDVGTYRCAACNLKLFSSKTKFDSGTGWPSFYTVIDARNVVDKVDKSDGETRTEVECARCGSHLGHVFDDG